MSWRQPFPSFDVPTWVEREPGLTDSSGHGGEYPWFIDEPFDLVDGEGLFLSLWVDHPDSDAWGTRYAVVVDTTEGSDNWPVVDTNDEEVARAALEWVRGQARTHGAKKFAALYPDGVHLFEGDSGLPRDPSVAQFQLRQAGVASPSVKRALDAINVHRAKVGMSPLDPGRAGWTDQDVVLEAERVARLANLGVMP